MGTKTLLSDTSKNADIKRQILRLCIIRDNYSIADLSRELNTSVPTVTKIIGELIEEGFLRDLGKSGLPVAAVRASSDWMPQPDISSA